jgi:hypothetical protein
LPLHVIYIMCIRIYIYYSKGGMEEFPPLNLLPTVNHSNYPLVHIIKIVGGGSSFPSYFVGWAAVNFPSSWKKALYKKAKQKV